MLYGIGVGAPVEGSAPVEVGESSVRAIPGVMRVVRLPYGVGALAETVWAALAARRALNDAVTWSRTGTSWASTAKRGWTRSLPTQAISALRRPTGGGRATRPGRWPGVQPFSKRPTVPTSP